MSNITPATPSFLFGYWRPWEENANLPDSYLDYCKDVSLAKYSADTVGKYISEASNERIQAINDIGRSIGRGHDILRSELSDINISLGFLNRNMDIQIEQQKLSNLLLHNIAELLRVPDSEKERQHSIELGIKFFVNAEKNADFYADALEELLKAESLMKQDYFVLHRIGCIYLHATKHIDPEKALDYFAKAAKYAIAESDSGAERLANVLTNNFNKVNSDINTSEKQIGLLAADSYEKASFSAYVLGRFEDAVNYQKNATKINAIPQNNFLLAKYQMRNGNKEEALQNLNSCIDQEPYLAIAAFKEIDLINQPEVIKLIAAKNDEINNKIKRLLEKVKSIESTKADSVDNDLTELLEKSYEIKIAGFVSFNNWANTINPLIFELESKINLLINAISTFSYFTFTEIRLSGFIKDLEHAKDLPLEEMGVIFDQIKNELDADKIKIGSSCAGGIVVYLDKASDRGLVVCVDKVRAGPLPERSSVSSADVLEQSIGISRWRGVSEIVKLGGLFVDNKYRKGDKVFSIAIAESFGLNEWANTIIRPRTCEAHGNGIADGTGMDNTKQIVDTFGINQYIGYFVTTTEPADTAASKCLGLSVGGFNDWYLPTINELALIYRTMTEVGSVIDKGTYWSSTEIDEEYVWVLRFGSVSADNEDHLMGRYRKNGFHKVLAVRVFMPSTLLQDPAIKINLPNFENKTNGDEPPSYSTPFSACDSENLNKEKVSEKTSPIEHKTISANSTETVMSSDVKFLVTALSCIAVADKRLNKAEVKSIVDTVTKTGCLMPRDEIQKLAVSTCKLVHRHGAMKSVDELCNSLSGVKGNSLCKLIVEAARMLLTVDGNVLRIDQPILSILELRLLSKVLEKKSLIEHRPTNPNAAISRSHTQKHVYPRGSSIRYNPSAYLCSAIILLFFFGQGVLMVLSLGPVFFFILVIPVIIIYFRYYHQKHNVRNTINKFLKFISDMLKT